jgi:hypothetical protein
MAKKYANGARIKDPTRKTETGAEAKIHCFNFVPRCHSHFRAKKALSNHLKIHRGAQNQHSQSAKARAQHKSTHPANAPIEIERRSTRSRCCGGLWLAACFSVPRKQLGSFMGGMIGKPMS